VPSWSRHRERRRAAARHHHATSRIIWDREGQPFGLVIDGRFYRVRHSPRLPMPPGSRLQLVFKLHSGPPPDAA